MNRDQLIDEITKTKEHLADMEKRLAEWKYERWKPEAGETHYFVNDINVPVYTHFCPTYKLDRERYKNFNCFQTKEQAEAEAEKILIRRMLEDIAERLNKGRKIDWQNRNQYKYYLSYDCYYGKEISLALTLSVKMQGVVYCLDERFCNAAIKEIGQERLERYLKGE